MYLQEWTNTGGIFCECFLIYFSSCLGYIWTTRMIFFFFLLIAALVTVGRRFLITNFGLEPAVRGLGLFSMSSLRILLLWSSFSKFGGAVFDNLHVSDISIGQILETESLKYGQEFPRLESLPAIVIHIFLSNITGTTHPSLAMVPYFKGDLLTYINLLHLFCSA